MPIGLSLHIGLNSVDPSHYQGWSGPLNACEADANSMECIAKAKNFSTKSLLTAIATRKNVIKEISYAASQLNVDDMFFLSYSGHGGQLPDWSGDESDQQDETWCLFDGQLVDDEIYGLLRQFRSGVRILVLSDSCHSGTVIKSAYYYGLNQYEDHGFTSNINGSIAYRFMPDVIARKVYEANRHMYDQILTNQDSKNSKSQIQATAILISGCQDNQYSADGAFNGLFTGTLLRVWNGGTFSGTYRELHSLILRRMPPDQSPNYMTVGVPNPTFEAQLPFTI